MKIAMFGIKGMPVPAGAENVAEQIGSRLVARGHVVTVYVRPHYTWFTSKAYKGCLHIIFTYERIPCR